MFENSSKAINTTDSEENNFVAPKLPPGYKMYFY